MHWPTQAQVQTTEVSGAPVGYITDNPMLPVHLLFLFKLFIITLKYDEFA